MATILMVGTAVHEVEGDIQRIDIRVIGVVDERALVLTFFHLHAHSDGSKKSHALSDGSGIESHAVADGGANHGGRDTGRVDEGQRVAMGLTLLVNIFYDR